MPLPSPDTNTRSSLRYGVSSKLQELYEEVAALTWSHCEHACQLEPRYDCCHILFCSLVRATSLRRGGLILESTGHPTLLFMGPQGCVVPPYLRPLCAKHTCVNNTLRAHPDPGPEWKKRYKELIDEIDRLELDSAAV